MKTKIIVNDTSFDRFCKELVQRTKEYPAAKLKETHAGDDRRCENSFMFTAIMETEE